jgi:hypothetical protein
MIPVGGFLARKADARTSKSLGARFGHRNQHRRRDVTRFGSRNSAASQQQSTRYVQD